MWDTPGSGICSQIPPAPTLPRLFLRLSNGIEIVAFAPTVWIYSLGHPAHTKQQLNLRVEQKKLSLQQEALLTVRWEADIQTPMRPSYVLTGSLPKRSFSRGRLFPSSTQLQPLPQASVLPAPKEFSGTISPTGPNLKQGDSEPSTPALQSAGTTWVFLVSQHLPGRDLCSLAERNPRQKNRKDRRQRKDRKLERRLHQHGSQ